MPDAEAVFALITTPAPAGSGDDRESLTGVLLHPEININPRNSNPMRLAKDMPLRYLLFLLSIDHHHPYCKSPNITVQNFFYTVNNLSCTVIIYDFYKKYYLTNYYAYVIYCYNREIVNLIIIWQSRQKSYKAELKQKRTFSLRTSCGILPDMRIRKDADSLQKTEIELIATASDALAHPARVELFRFVYSQNMKRQPVCNKNLVEEFDYAQATISQHMKKLLISGLVTAEKKGTYSYYFVNLGMLAKYLDTVKKLNS